MVKTILGLATAPWLREQLAEQLASQGIEPQLLPPALPQDDWGVAWERWIRFLEESAPCLFWILDDWDCNAIVARLSNRIKVIAYVREFHPEIARLGHFCDALVVPEPWLRLQISYRLPQLAPRAIGWAPAQLNGLLQRTAWRRQTTYLQPSLSQLAQSTSWQSALQFVHETPLWPDPAPRQVPPIVSHTPAPPGPWKIFMAVGGGQISGVDVFASHLVRALRSAGHDARILGERAMSNQQALPFGLDIPVDSLGLTRETSWRKRCQAALDFLESQAPCIYIPNYEFEQASMIPQLSPGVKVLLIGHSDDPTHYEQMLRLGPYSDGIAVVSQAIADHLVRLNPHLQPRIQVIPYGVQLSSAPAPSAGGPLRILYAGRLVAYQKRVADLLLIAAELKARRLPFQLSLVGEGRLRSWLEAEIERLDLGEQVLLLGKLSNASLLEHLSQYQVLLLPSAFEGLPVALLEAMAHGLVPVVSSIRSGVPELLVHGHNGLLAPVGDIQAFADQLAELYHHPETWRRLSQAAMATIRQGPYQLAEMVGSYLQMFAQMAGQCALRPNTAWRPPPGLSEVSVSYQILDKIREWSRSLG